MFDWIKRASQGANAPEPRPTPASDLAESYSLQALSADKPRRVHLSFSGEVQAVGFRWNARNCANEIGLTGWVRNEYDGSVTMEIQGTSDQIARFFTLFNNQYRHHQISYTIDQKVDMPTLDDETDFSVVFR